MSESFITQVLSVSHPAKILTNQICSFITYCFAEKVHYLNISYLNDSLFHFPLFSTFQNIQHRKYAKWKAAYIHNCLKNGETPQPGPIGMEGEAYGKCWYYICSPRMILWLPLTKYTPAGGLSFTITEWLSPCESVVSESVNVSTLCALSKLWKTQEMTNTPSDPPPASQHRLLFM